MKEETWEKLRENNTDIIFRRVGIEGKGVEDDYVGIPKSLYSELLLQSRKEWEEANEATPQYRKDMQDVYEKGRKEVLEEVMEKIGKCKTAGISQGGGKLINSQELINKIN